MVNTRPNGSYIQERVTQNAAQVIKYELGYPKFDFISLRYTHITNGNVFRMKETAPSMAGGVAAVTAKLSADSIYIINMHRKTL